MKKAIGLKVDLEDLSNPDVKEYRSYVEDIWNSGAVKRLHKYEQHHKTSRLQHSINVSYYSFLIAKKIGADPCKAARAGLLHDLYWYDWHRLKIGKLHAFLHPKLAVRNAKRISDLSERESDAILKHMWPLYPGMPKYKESYAVTLADKYVATLEVATQWSKTIGNTSANKTKKTVKKVKHAVTKVPKRIIKINKYPKNKNNKK